MMAGCKFTGCTGAGVWLMKNPVTCAMTNPLAAVAMPATLISKNLIMKREKCDCSAKTEIPRIFGCRVAIETALMGRN